MEAVEKTQMTQKDLVEFTQVIANAQTLDDINEINKRLLSYEMNGYKASVVTMAKTRRREIIEKLIQEKPVFNATYFLIRTANGNTLKQAGKLLYALKEYGVLTKGEVNYLFDVYESRKQKVNGVNGEEEIEEE